MSNQKEFKTEIAEAMQFNAKQKAHIS